MVCPPACRRSPKARARQYSFSPENKLFDILSSFVLSPTSLLESLTHIRFLFNRRSQAELSLHGGNRFDLPSHSLGSIWKALPDSVLMADQLTVFSGLNSPIRDFSNPDNAGIGCTKVDIGRRPDRGRADAFDACRGSPMLGREHRPRRLGSAREGGLGPKGSASPSLSRRRALRCAQLKSEHRRAPVARRHIVR